MRPCRILRPADAPMGPRRALVEAGWVPAEPTDAALEAAARCAGRGLFPPRATPPEAWRRSF